MSHGSDERDRDRDRCGDRDGNRHRDRSRERERYRNRDRSRDREASWRYYREFEDRSHLPRLGWLPFTHHRSRSPSANRSPSSSGSSGYNPVSRDRIYVNYRSCDTSDSRRNWDRNENQKSRGYSEARPLFNRYDRGRYGNKPERNCRLSMLEDLPCERELNTDVKSDVSKQERCVEKKKYPDDRNKLCSYCGDHIDINQGTIHEGQGYHSKCLKTHEPKGKDALAQFKRHVKRPAVLLALHVSYVYSLAPQSGKNLSKKESSRRKDAKREKREAKVKELLRFVSAFRNSVSGYIIIHLIGLDPDDRNTGELDELIDKKLGDLLWGEQFDVVYKKQRLNSHGKLDTFGDFISLYVAKSSYVTTLDYKTKVATDNCLQEPDQSFVHEFLRKRQDFEEEFPQLGENFCTEDIETLTENRSVQFKSRSEAKTVEEIVDAIKSLRVTEYISAHSKLENGGSFFYGVKENMEERKGYGYMTKRTHVQTSYIDDPESFIQLMLKTIRQNVLVCGYQGDKTEEDVVKVTCVSEKGNRCKSVVVISSRFVRGLVFYDKSGPLAYWYNEQGTEAVRQLTLSEWFFAITRRRDEPFKDNIKTVVSSSDERTQGIATTLLDILRGESIFNHQNLAEPEIPLQKMASKKGLLFVCESLSVPLDMGDISRPESVVCDVFILLPNQPMVILTFVEGSVGDEATAYNTGCAGGLTRTLSRYMDVNLEVLYRAISVSLLTDLVAFDAMVKDIARDCSLFVTKDSLVMNGLRYKMCLKAFWTKIAEAKVLSEMDGQIKERKLRFLTESQYDILVNNLDKAKVKISSEPGSGARTLMVETARRLNRMSPTLVVCDSLEERETLRLKYHFVKTSDELRTSDLLKFSCILDSTGSVCVRSKGRLWAFSKGYHQSSGDKRDLISTIEEQLERKRGLLTILSSHDEREGLQYILREVDTLILMKTNLKEFAMNYQQLVLVTETGQKKIDAEHCEHYAQRLNEGLSDQRELFPLLSESSRRLKDKKSYLTSKISYLDDVVSSPKQMEEKTPGIIKEEEAYEEQTSKRQLESGTSETKVEIGTSKTQKEVDEGLKERSSEEANLIPSDETQMKGETSEEETDFKETKEVKELEKRLEDLKERAEIQWKKIEADATQMDDLLPWEFSIDSVSEKLTANALGAFVSEVTGFGFILYLKAVTKPLTTDGRCRSKSSVTLLRQFQHGELRRKTLMKMLDETIRTDYEEFSKLQRRSDRLENITGYPIYIVGTVENIKSSYVSCPNMVLDEKRVNSWLKVFGDRPVKLKVITEKDEKEHTQQFIFYEGTCSEPIYHRTTSFTIPRYWEAHVRLRVTGRVTVWEPLFEIAICQESQLDIQPLLSNNKYQPHSWSVTVADCYSHRPGVCTRVFRYGQRVRKCWDNTLEHLPGSNTVLRFGVVLDVSRGRLAFLDLVKGFLLQRFDEEFTEDLYPMFGIDPDKDDCNVEIELVSGNQVQMTDSKRDLIQRALFSQ